MDAKTPAADDLTDTLRRIAESTNADRLLWGQFAKFGDKIQIDATLQDLKQQRSLTLKATAAREEELPRAIEQLANDVQKRLALPADVIKELRATALKPSTRSLQALRYYNEGVQLAHQAKNSEALKSFQSSIKEDSNFALAYAKLGQVYGSLGYGNEAEQAARRAVDLSENLSPHEKYLIEAIRAETTNDTQKAIEAYENLSKLLPEDPDVQFALAGLYNNAGSFDVRGVEAEYEHVWDSGAALRANLGSYGYGGVSASDVSSAHRLGKLAASAPLAERTTLAWETILASRRGAVSGHGLSNLTIVRSFDRQRARISISLLDVFDRSPAEPAGDSVLQLPSPGYGRSLRAKLELAF